MTRFCAKYEFHYVDRASLGRYPRVRIQRVGATTIWIELFRELDAQGRRKLTFARTDPYELSAGAFVVLPDGSEHGVRLQHAVQCFSGTPFDDVASVLRDSMEKQLPLLEQWDLAYLEEHGRRVKLGRR